MRRAIDRRLVRAEEAAKSTAPKFLIIRVRGGLAGPVRCATIDGVHWKRLLDETVEQFEDRLLAAATATKAKTIVIGGPLCGCAWPTSEDFAAYLAGPDFARFDPDGIAIEPQANR